MSNCNVSSTRTSWPRFVAASTSMRVLYNDSWRDRMTSRMHRPPALIVWRTVKLNGIHVLAPHVDHEVAGQGLAAEQDAVAHAGAARHGQANALLDRTQAHQRLDHGPALGDAAGVADHDETQHRHAQHL